MGKWEEEKLLEFYEKFKRGDSDAMNKLIKFYKGYINNKCNYLKSSIQMHKEDIKQELLIKLVQACKSFKGKSWAELHSLIYKALDNRFYTVIEKYSRYTSNVVHCDDFEYLLKDKCEYTIEKFALYDYKRKELMELVEPYLSKKENVLLIKLMEGKYLKEISEELGEKYNTVVKRRVRLKKKMHELLRKLEYINKLS